MFLISKTASGSLTFPLSYAIIFAVSKEEEKDHGEQNPEKKQLKPAHICPRDERIFGPSHCRRHLRVAASIVLKFILLPLE